MTDAIALIVCFVFDNVDNDCYDDGNQMYIKDDHPYDISKLLGIFPSFCISIFVNGIFYRVDDGTFIVSYISLLQWSSTHGSVFCLLQILLLLCCNCDDGKVSSTIMSIVWLLLCTFF